MMRSASRCQNAACTAADMLELGAPYPCFGARGLQFGCSAEQQQRMMHSILNYGSMLV